MGLAILTPLVVKLDITFSDQNLALGASNLTFVGKLRQLGLLLRIKEWKLLLQPSFCFFGKTSKAPEW
jgi:hypothetical protein